MAYLFSMVSILAYPSPLAKYTVRYNYKHYGKIKMLHLSAIYVEFIVKSGKLNGFNYTIHPFIHSSDV